MTREEVLSERCAKCKQPLYRIENGHALLTEAQKREVEERMKQTNPSPRICPLCKAEETILKP